MIGSFPLDWRDFIETVEERASRIYGRRKTKEVQIWCGMVPRKDKAELRQRIAWEDRRWMGEVGK